MILSQHYAYAYCGTVSRKGDVPRNTRPSTLNWRGFSVSILHHRPAILPFATLPANEQTAKRNHRRDTP
jgi:hypothetical protein